MIKKESRILQPGKMWNFPLVNFPSILENVKKGRYSCE